jgi:hypothetical protein
MQVETAALKLQTLMAGAWGVLVISAAAQSAPSPPVGPPPELQKARETLKLSEQTRDRVAEEVAALKATGKASPEAVKAYETYLARVEDLVAENRKLAAQMEAAYSAHQARSQPVPAGTSASPNATPPPPGSQEDSVDRLQALDRQFNESLAAFDEMLLKELRLIQAASAKRMKGLADAAAEAGRQAGEKGGGSSSTEKGSTAEGEAGGSEGTEREKGGSEQAKTPGGQGKPGDAAGGGRETGGWGAGGSGAPPSTYSPSPDDDIVARQLREAAEKETDPELKAKLWKEYEEYKKSRAKP